MDYDFATISGEKFLLPLKADLHFRGGRALVWNEIEFHLYRKFSADANITFRRGGGRFAARRDSAGPVAGRAAEINRSRRQGPGEAHGRYNDDPLRCAWAALSIFS